MACNIKVRFSSALRGNTNGANDATVESAQNVKTAINALLNSITISAKAEYAYAI